ncbi:MAG: hypothetical protein J6Q22_10745 [Prevotella sp.]|nr:hypothetical protein [Prevotella sp.]
MAVDLAIAILLLIFDSQLAFYMVKKLKEVKIIRGNDTTFSGNAPIKIQINTKADLTGFTASLFFGSVVKDFTEEEVSSKLLKLAYTSEETEQFFPGRGFALLKLYDSEGRQATIWRFVFNVIFPYEKPTCGGYAVEVVIGDAESMVDVKYDEETETLIVDYKVSERDMGQIMGIF